MIGKTISFLIASLVAAPILIILSSWRTPMDDVFLHLVTTGLSDVLRNTLWLVIGAAVGTTFLGVSLAMITTTFEFPGRSFFNWALVLPLAIPTYVLAFIAIALFDVTGPVHSQLRAWGFSGLPGMRSRFGIIFVMTMALYPYVYLLARNGFLSTSKRATEVAQSLGQTSASAFFKVILPMTQPMILSGLMLVVMETLADFGAVSIFNYDTLTTTLYKAWFSMFSLDSAAKFSSLLIVLVFLILWIEKKARQRKRYTSSEKQPHPNPRKILKGASRLCAVAYCFIILLIAFMLPILYLLSETFSTLKQDLDLRYFGFLGRSLALSAMAAILIVLSAWVIGLAGRRGQSLIVRLATLGYALPGTILAVGGIIMVTFLDHTLASLFHWDGLFLTGTLCAMMLGYAARFLTLAHNPIESALHRITPHIEEAARSLGLSSFNILKKIHFPLLKSGVMTGALLVFVDVMKEMPITLMTRPFGWDTLAVKIFQFTAEGEWDRAALPAITLVLFSLVPVILLASERSERRLRVGTPTAVIAASQATFAS
jgi:iron(III) transport system permease protein